MSTQTRKSWTRDQVKVSSLCRKWKIIPRSSESTWLLIETTFEIIRGSRGTVWFSVMLREKYIRKENEICFPLGSVDREIYGKSRIS